MQRYACENTKHTSSYNQLDPGHISFTSLSKSKKTQFLLSPTILQSAQRFISHNALICVAGYTDQYVISIHTRKQ